MEGGFEGATIIGFEGRKVDVVGLCNAPTGVYLPCQGDGCRFYGLRAIAAKGGGDVVFFVPIGKECGIELVLVEIGFEKAGGSKCPIVERNLIGGIYYKM